MRAVQVALPWGTGLQAVAMTIASALPARMGLAPGAGPVVQGGVEAAGGEPPSDVGHGAGRDADLVGDLLVGVPGVGPQEDLDPVSLPAGERAGLLLAQGRTLVMRQSHDVSLRHDSPPGRPA